RARPRARMARQRLAARHCPPPRRAAGAGPGRRAGPHPHRPRRGAGPLLAVALPRAAGTAARGRPHRPGGVRRVRGAPGEAAREAAAAVHDGGDQGDAAVGHRPRRRAGRPPERPPGPPPPPRLTTPDSAHGRTERITSLGRTAAREDCIAREERVVAREERVVARASAERPKPPGRETVDGWEGRAGTGSSRSATGAAGPG